MDKDTAMRKIKACLELSRSDNANEAAAAIRQANVLMKKFNIAHHETQIETREVLLNWMNLVRAPAYAVVLIQCISTAFSCENVLTRRQGSFTRLTYVGCGAGPKLAEYLHIILMRKAINLRKEVFKKHRATVAKAITAAKVADEYVLGWAFGILNKVDAMQLGGPPQQALDYAIKKTNGLQLKQKNIKIQTNAFDAGVQEGLKVKIHSGIGGNAIPLQIEGKVNLNQKNINEVVKDH